MAANGLGSAAYGREVPTFPVHGLPWTNVDRVTVMFDSDVLVDAADLTVRGVVGATQSRPLNTTWTTRSLAVWASPPGHSRAPWLATG